MRYSLRTLLILMALGPPLIAWLNWARQPPPPTPNIVFGGEDDFEPWHEPGTPQAASLRGNRGN